MSNKLFFFVALALLLVSFVSAADFVYLIKDNAGVDNSVVTGLNSLGYSFDVVEDRDIPGIDFSEYSALIVMDGTFTNSNLIPVKQMNSLVGNTFYVDDWGIADYVSVRTSTGYHSAKVFKNHPVSFGSETSFNVYNTRGLVLYYLPHAIRRATNFERIIVTDDSNAYPLIGIINKNGRLWGGGTAGGRILYFSMTETGHWTNDVKLLFENSLVWVLKGDDKDGDGFKQDIDCNDNDNSIYPGANEIPYDGIDQDCNGYDFVDVDEDGYESDLVGGNDCDDDDFFTNPGSSDLALNCVNDGPVIDSIGDIVVFEGDEVLISVIASDPENDGLTYSINDARFNKSDNVFSWLTGFEDKGNYQFEISVSDGEIENEVFVNVEIKNSNRLPECLIIPEIIWSEDNNYFLDLNDFCSDPDGDFIAFGLSDTTEDDNIVLVGLDNGIAEFRVVDNWFGVDWVIFSISDNGIDFVYTNKVDLRVEGVNDGPVFSGNIEDVSWNEDEILEWVDLNEFFKDVDSQLIFNVVGNSFISVEINDGMVKLNPSSDWYGSETLVFSASDGEYETFSNSVVLTVIDQNEPPVFDDFNCDINILEDVEYYCELLARDYEGDDISFEIRNSDKLVCNLDNNLLKYQGLLDYSGFASCLIRVSDGEGHSDYLFEVNIGDVNDEPVLSSISPSGSVSLLEDEEKEFRISGSDIDSELIVKWFVDDVEVGSGGSYSFKGKAGNYVIKAVISDGEFSLENSWDVFVGLTSDFTCSELKGNSCNVDDICKGTEIDDSEAGICCSIACSVKPPKFSDVKNRCLSNDFDIHINEPEDNDEFNLGENIKVEVEIDNTLSEDIDLDVDIYLINLEEDEKMDDLDESVEVKDGREERLKFEFETFKDYLEGKYGLFVYAKDGDYCSEDYILIDLERVKHDVVIEEFDLSNLKVECGEYFNVDVFVKNYGTEEEDVELIVENSLLGFSVTEEFVLEEFDEDDFERRKFSIFVGSVESGDYEIRGKVKYGNREDKISKSLKVICEEKIEKIDSDIVVIGGDNVELGVFEKARVPILSFNKGIIMIVMLTIIFAFFTFFVWWVSV